MIHWKSSRHWLLLVMLVVLSLVVVSCGRDRDEVEEPTQVVETGQGSVESPEASPEMAETDVAVEEPAQPAADAPAGAGGSSLEGTNWLNQFYVDAQGELAPAQPGNEPSALFEGGQVGGTTGCNSYGATYEVSGDQLTVQLGMTTMMACPEPLMEQEGAYLAALGSSASFAVNDGKLEIADAGGNTVLIFGELQPVALTGTLWQLTGYNNGKGGFASPLAGTEVNAVFGEDGSMVGSAGCNSYTATFVAEEGNIAIGQPAATAMACAGPEGIMEQESAYLAATQSVIAYEIVGDTLTLSNVDGQRYLTYVAAPAGEEPEAATPAFEPQIVTPDVVANLTYMSAFTASGEAPLTDGMYSEPAAPGSATQVTVLLTEHQVYTPLEDGEEAAAVILVTDPGGSGTFYDLALVTSQDGDVANVTSVPLGDRIQVNSLTFEDGVIAVDMVVHGPDDPMCCPTQRVVQTFVVRAGELVEGSSTVIGTEEPAAESPAPAGGEEGTPAVETGPEAAGDAETEEFPRVLWQLVEMQPAGGEVIVVDQPDRYTLELVSDVRVAITADCNRGGGAYEVDGNQVTITITTMTMAMCAPDSLSDAFVAGLNATTSFEVQEDTLMLYADDGSVMKFERS